MKKKWPWLLGAAYLTAVMVRLLMGDAWTDWKTLYGIPTGVDIGIYGNWGDPDYDRMPNRWEYLSEILDPLNVSTIFSNNLYNDYNSWTADWRIAYGTVWTDMDGMPELWESEHHLDPTNYDAQGDLDADGWDNLSEYMADTDPSDDGDFPRPTVSGIIRYGGDRDVSHYITWGYYTNSMDGPPAHGFTSSTPNFVFENVAQSNLYILSWGDVDDDEVYETNEPIGVAQGCPYEPVRVGWGGATNVVVFMHDWQACQYYPPVSWNSLAAAFPGTTIWYFHIDSLGGGAVAIGEIYLRAPRDFYFFPDYTRTLTYGDPSTYFSMTGGLKWGQAYRFTARQTNRFGGEYDQQYKYISYSDPTDPAPPAPDVQQTDLILTQDTPRVTVGWASTNWTIALIRVGAATQTVRLASAPRWGFVPFSPEGGFYTTETSIVIADTNPAAGGSYITNAVQVRIARPRIYSSAHARRWSDWSTEKYICFAATNPPSGPAEARAMISGDVYYYGKAQGISQRFDVRAYRSPSWTDPIHWSENRVTYFPGEYKTNALKGSFYLRGLPKETSFYVMAFIDSNTNGTVEAWESQGFVETSAYRPYGFATHGAANIYSGLRIEVFDRDTDGDHLPDAWEWSQFGTLGYGPEDDPGATGMTVLERYGEEPWP